MNSGTRPTGNIFFQGTRQWPSRDFSAENARGWTPEEVQQLYEQGFAGAIPNPSNLEKLWKHVESEQGGRGTRNAAFVHENFKGDGAGKLTILYPYVDKCYPGCFPGAAQQCGDCVSHATFKGAMTTFCCDVVLAKPDEVTGQVEEAPQVDPVGIQNGGFSSEAIYWYRGYNGDGWDCGAAAQVCLQMGAAWPRNNYPDLNVDLRVYSAKNAHRYGSQSPPSNFTQAGQKHLIRTATNISTIEQLRDIMANGYGVSSCGNEGFSSQRDENGFSRRQGSWSHGFPFYGVDDRDIIKQKYGEPMVCCSNNWGAWNSGGTRILGTELDIPAGFWWARWSDVKNRQIIAFSGANGWPKKVLPPIDTGAG